MKLMNSSDPKSTDEEFSSPELLRGTSLSADQRRLLSTSVGCFLNVTPDIKNSTINPCSSARNIGDLPELECSPVEHRNPCSLFSNSRDPLSLKWNLDETNFLGSASNSQAVQQASATCNNPVPGEVVEEKQNKSEICETQDEDEFSKVEQTRNSRERCQTFNEQLITPDPLDKAKRFLKFHHSCLSKPPPHWTESPITVRSRKQPFSSSTDLANNLDGCAGVPGVDADTVFVEEEQTESLESVLPNRVKRNPPLKGLRPKATSNRSTSQTDNRETAGDTKEVTDWIVRIVSDKD